MLADETLDFDFHVAAARELIRVGREVRIYPTYTITGEARWQPFVEPLMEVLRTDGSSVELVPSHWVQGEFASFNDVLMIKRS
jgi:hypothetical protein